MESDTLVNLRMKTSGLSKQPPVAEARNFQTSSTSSQKNQLTHKLTGHKSTKSLAYGLKGAGRQDNYLGTQESVTSGCMSTKNQTSHFLHSNSQSQFKTKLQSKYGISAQNKMFANGSLKPRDGAQNMSKQYISNGNKDSANNKRAFSRNGAQPFRHTTNTNLPKVEEPQLSNNRTSKYANPYIFHRKNLSKNLGPEDIENLRQTADGHTKLRYRDSSEHVASLMTKDFKMSSTNLPLMGNSKFSRKLSDYEGQNTCISQERLNSKLRAPTILTSQTTEPDEVNTSAFFKDIRDATTVREVRDIMNQVKSKYRNSLSTKASSINR